MQLPSLRFALVSAVLVGSAACLRAADTGTASASAASFTSGLPAWAKNADGLNKLTAEQQKALNDAVAHDISLAQQGDTVAFANSFSARRTEAQRAALGLNQLSFEQLNHLNDDVAHAIAYRPQLSVAPAPRGEGSMVNAGAIASFKRPWQTHGELELTIGGSKRGTFYGGTAEIYETDPSGNFTLSVAVSQFRGKGLPYCYDGPYAYGYGPYRYGGYGPYPYGY
jgi:hypothetical protein